MRTEGGLATETDRQARTAAPGGASWAGGALWALLLFTLATGAAVAGAIITGAGVSGLVGGVESLSSSSSTLLERPATPLLNRLDSASAAFGLVFAFSAGMVSSVNPCGFAMLPAYLGLYLGDRTATGSGTSVQSRLGRAVLVGAVMSAGFVVLFGAVGLAIAAGARPLIGIFPWIGLGIGVLLTATGAWLATGGSLYNALGERLSARIGGTGQRSVRGYFAFGLGYGIASLSCTLSIFLAVVGSSLTVGSLLDATLRFVSYGVGMGSVILALTVSMVIFQQAMVRLLRRTLPYIQPASAVFLLVAGSFITYYWLTIGRDLLTA